MGIPSYYSYLIKKHPEILRSFLETPPDHLYLDANSIIYDIVNGFSFTEKTVDSEVILLVILKIEGYVELFRPIKTVTIAFDGPAPRAKLKQQRERRFKTAYLNKAHNHIFKDYKYTLSHWFDTAKITPGTKFMDLLTKMVRDHFTQPNYNLLLDDSGEGEHKLFKVLRNHSLPDETHIIYGLDSDLIMISMMHDAKIYLYRETPHYIRNFNPMLNEETSYLLDINALSSIIEDEMCGGIHDYVFISFLMGNDFMPHFPALNIRTGGIDKMIDAYKNVKLKIVEINRESKKIKINWDNFYQVLQILSEKEETYIQTEYLSRFRKKWKDVDTPEFIFRKIENMPILERDTELYIDPTKKGWESRYYETLVGGDAIKDYLKGLVWNISYYTFGCIDWEWYYPFHYPPLIKDLCCFIPMKPQIIKYSETENNITAIEQLCYVLPKNSLDLIPEDIRAKLPSIWYIEDCSFTWAFCKYFWESHPDLPDIDFVELRKMIQKN